MENIIREYNGGIQPGTSATSPASKKLDEVVKEGVRRAYQILVATFPDSKITYSDHIALDRIKEKTQKRGDVMKIMPDGGVILINGEVVLFTEAKHQGNAGNAMERLYRYSYILDHAASTTSTPIREDRKYLIYLSGQGSKQNGVMRKTISPLMSAENIDFDDYEVNKHSRYSVFTDPKFFSVDEISRVAFECVSNLIKPLVKP